MQKIIKKLTDLKKTISTMESATGGGIANAITNINGASEVFSFSAVTYSNDFKIKMGIKPETIDKYSVYSQEIADEMSYCICQFTHSNYGIGITGKLNKEDKHNLFKENNIVYISIYDSDNNKYYHEKIKVTKNKRIDNKKLVIDKVISMLDNIISV